MKHVCVICGEEFRAKRKDALYCSTGCRQAAHRQRSGILNTGQGVQWNLRQLAATAKNPRLHHLAMTELRAAFELAAALIAEIEGVQRIDTDWWLVMDEKGQMRMICPAGDEAIEHSCNGADGDG